MIKAIEWLDDKVRLLDQTKLPNIIEFIDCYTYIDIANAIKEMKVRGAPAIGIVVAMGLALYAKKVKVENTQELITELVIASQLLQSTRPTAVNLFWAINRMKSLARENELRSVKELKELLVNEALLIHAEDEQMCRMIGEYGSSLVPIGANILTHCNAGALATGGYGTALGVIRKANELGKNIHVFVDETRPLLQGSRLTAWELLQENIPFTLITDNMAGHFISRGKVDLIVTGADRITSLGDTANKIGTYTLAVLAKENNIPFYIAAPSSTIDFDISRKDQIIIESRNTDEVAIIGERRFAPENINIANPSFDVTPHRYITAIITEKGVIHPPFDKNLKVLRN